MCIYPSMKKKLQKDSGTGLEIWPLCFSDVNFNFGVLSPVSKTVAKIFSLINYSAPILLLQKAFTGLTDDNVN